MVHRPVREPHTAKRPSFELEDMIDELRDAGENTGENAGHWLSRIGRRSRSCNKTTMLKQRGRGVGGRATLQQMLAGGEAVGTLCSNFTVDIACRTAQCSVAVCVTRMPSISLVLFALEHSPGILRRSLSLLVRK
jgi:hypothetical protein